jgi:hypothetical protein
MCIGKNLVGAENLYILVYYQFARQFSKMSSSTTLRLVLPKTKTPTQKVQGR